MGGEGAGEGDIFLAKGKGHQRMEFKTSLKSMGSAELC